jgi:hypothetical protein
VLAKRYAWSLGCVAAAAFLLIPTSASAQTFQAVDFFEPNEGDYWIYRLNGAQLVAVETVAIVPAGGFTYLTSLWTGGPLDGLETTSRFNPAIGVEVLSNFQPSIFIDGVGFVDQRQDLSPPILAAPPTITIGEVVQTMGGLTQTYSNAFDSVSLLGTYSAAYRFALVEPISVPFGSFDAIQRQIQIDLALQIAPGQWEEVRATSRDWIVPGLGGVKIEQTFPGRVDVYELLDTNRMVVPEPATTAQLIAAILSLLMLRRRSCPSGRYRFSLCLQILDRR